MNGPEHIFDFSSLIYTRVSIPSFQNGGIALFFLTSVTSIFVFVVSFNRCAHALTHIHTKYDDDGGGNKYLKLMYSLVPDKISCNQYMCNTCN